MGRLAALILLGALTACASTPKTAAIVWSGGDPKQLAADEAGCHQESASVDVQDPNVYSDPRYGVTSAMAEAIAKDNPLADRTAIVREAAFESCMNDKGWTSSQQ
jgi:hypothetical protein